MDGETEECSAYSSDRQQSQLCLEMIGMEISLVHGWREKTREVEIVGRGKERVELVGVEIIEHRRFREKRCIDI